MGHYTIVFYILSPTQATIEFVISCVLLTIDIVFLVHDVLLYFLAPTSYEQKKHNYYSRINNFYIFR